MYVYVSVCQLGRSYDGSGDKRPTFAVYDNTCTAGCHRLYGDKL